MNNSTNSSIHASDHDTILASKEDGLAKLILNRPQKRNALTLQMYEDLRKYFEDFSSDDSIRCIILMGRGENAFSSGTDISEFRTFSRPEDAIAYEHMIEKTLCAMEGCSKPIITLLSGVCTGGGFALAACSDLRIAQSNFSFGLPMARTLGNCLSPSNVLRFSRLVGSARFTELIMTGRMMSSDEAEKIGLVTKVAASHSDMVSSGEEMARQIIGLAPITLAVSKEALRRVHSNRLDGDDLVARAYGSHDFQEGLDAFLSKRPPDWQGV